MTNAYYSKTHPFSRYTTARGEAVDEELSAIEEGFSRIPAVENFNTGTVTFASDLGTANAHRVTLSNGAEAPTAGVHVAFKAAGTNTGPATLVYQRSEVQSWPEKQIKRIDGSELLPGDIQQEAMLELRYTGQYWAILSTSLTAFNEKADRVHQEYSALYPYFVEFGAAGYPTDWGSVTEGRQVASRGGSTADHTVFIGVEREVTVDTDKNTAVVHDGVTPGGHPLAKLSDVVPAFGTVYAGGVLTAADNGKSFSMDLGTQEVLSIADVATLPVGWSITLMATGAPSAFQTASIQVAGGQIWYQGESDGSEFFLIGGRESFRLIKNITGVLEIYLLAHPIKNHVIVSGTGVANWNTVPTAWTNLFTNSQTHGYHLLNHSTGGGQIAVSGDYYIHARGYYKAVSGVPGIAHLQLLAANHELDYAGATVFSEHPSFLSVKAAVRLRQGDLITARHVGPGNNVHYLPDYDHVKIWLRGR